jgi:hypothetical protein
MSRSQAFRKIVLCVGMEMAALMGAPLRPDELADLFRSKQQAGIETSVRKDGEDPDPSYGSSLDQSVSPRGAADNEGLLS